MELGKAQKSRAHAIVMKTGNSTTSADNISVNGRDFDEMFDEMEEDGLIDRSKPYTIIKDNNELLINGKTQPASVLKKYKSYLDGDRINISGTQNSTSININD